MLWDLQVKLNPDWLLSATQPSVADFHQLFAAVFVDPSGRLNLCADVTASTYNQVPTGFPAPGSSMAWLRHSVSVPGPQKLPSKAELDRGPLGQ